MQGLAGFEEWLREVSPGSFEGDAVIPDGWRSWLEELYRREGPISGPELEAREREAMRTAAEAALVSVLDDAERVLEHRPVMEVFDDDGSLRINYLTDHAVEVGPSGGLLNGPDDVDALVTVADAVFDLLAHELCAVPFVCPFHSTGLHPQDQNGRAVWWCERGQHTQGEIGKLKHRRR